MKTLAPVRRSDVVLCTTIALALAAGCGHMQGGGASEIAPRPELVEPTPAPIAAQSVDATEGPDAAPDAPVCEVICERARVSLLADGLPRSPDAESHTVDATRNAEAVLEAKNAELVTCYQSRLRRVGNAEGSVHFDIVVGSDGRVVSAEGSGPPALAPVMACMTDVIRKATFSPPHGAGTSSVAVDLVLRRTAADGDGSAGI